MRSFLPGRLRRPLLSSLLAAGAASAALAAALPATASATTYCAPAPCSPGTPQATIPDAVTAADTNAGPDTVSIGAGTHNLGTGLFVGQPDTDVHGAGIAQTILTGDPFPLSDPGTGRTIISGYMSRLADVTLRLPSAVTSGPSSWTGVDIYDGLVEDVKIDAQGATFGADINDGAGDAMFTRGGQVRRLEIDFPANADVTGLRVGHIGGTFDLEDVTIHSPHPFSSGPQASPTPADASTVTARRFRIESADPIQVFDGFLELSDSVIDVSSAPPATGPEDFPAAATVADGRSPSPAGLSLDRITLIGNGDADAAAFSIAGQGATPVTSIQARHIVADGFGRTVAFQNFGSNPTATINFSNVPLGPGTLVNTGTDPATLGGNQTAGNRGGDPMLLADFSLPFASPAVDIGGNSLLPGPATDLVGNPRPADGNGDGFVLNDAGAFERVYTPDGATLRIEGRKVELNEKGKGKVPLTCPPATEQPSPCTAKLKLRTRKQVKFKGNKKQITIAKSKQKTIPAGETKNAKIKIKAAKLELLQENKKARKVEATAKLTDGNDEPGTVTKNLKLKPKS